jgi:hypothetical protein
MNAIEFAVHVVGKALTQGTLNLVVRHGEHSIGAHIQPDDRDAAFERGKVLGCELAGTSQRATEQRTLRHLARLLRTGNKADWSIIGDLATWLVVGSHQWPVLQPHADVGRAVVVSIERGAYPRLKVFFEVWKERDAA